MEELVIIEFHQDVLWKRALMCFMLAAEVLIFNDITQS